MPGKKGHEVLQVYGVDPADPALRWLVAYDPSIAIEADHAGVTLRSASLSSADLEDALLCARVNESTFLSAADGRRRILEALLT